MIRRILAINFGGLGDEILFLPALISLKKEYPNAKITLAVEPRSKGIKDLTDIIDDVILVDIKNKNKYTELFNLVTKAIFGNFQMVVASGGSPLMAVIEAMTFIPKRYGYDNGILSRLLLTKAVPLNKNQYAVKMYHDLVTPITSHTTELPKLNIEQENKLPNSVLIHPGVSLMSKRKNCIKTIDSKGWAELIDKISLKGKDVILAGGPDDKECIEEITKYCKTTNYKNYYGLTKNLKDLAKLISAAEIFVCSDSAPLHIAVSMSTKTYVFFGPTDDKKLIPQSDRVIALKSNDTCPLKPCLWDKKQESCNELICLKYNYDEIAQRIVTNT